MVRGALVQLAATDETGQTHPEAIKAAAAMELTQAFLLIHDDIMDRDETRRGERSLYAQYQSVGVSERVSQPDHFGISLGICAGDVASFLATELLTDIDTDASTQQRMIGLYSREIAHVGLAQMGDLSNGAQNGPVTAAEIEAVYRHKTGRYTFSLPLMLGALVRGCAEEELAALSRFGELAGIAFQLKDDELGLLADADTLGKPIGSDIVENKKTLHRLFLFDAATQSERAHLEGLFGAESVSQEDVDWVRTLLEHYRVTEQVQETMQRYGEEASQLLKTLPGLAESSRKSLRELLHYNAIRDR